MIKLGRKFISTIFLIFFSLSLVFGTFNLGLNALTINQNDKLIERISKDFSRKFCNGIGFGLSKESAMNFAIKENIAIFKKKKGIENIDNKILAEEVSISVFDKCGYQLNLSEDEWISMFDGLNSIDEQK
tara:strand:- start:191 stop:580 length:390 start_codon:yes stop_codon:yes gene_type:complete